MNSASERRRVTFYPTKTGYMLRVNGRIVASRLTKIEAAFHKRRILREMKDGTYKGRS